MDYLEKLGETHPETRRDLLTNTLVAICSTDAEWGPYRRFAACRVGF